jgi:hypothetical protein
MKKHGIMLGLILTILTFLAVMLSTGMIFTSLEVPKSDTLISNQWILMSILSFPIGVSVWMVATDYIKSNKIWVEWITFTSIWLMSFAAIIYMRTYVIH